MKGGTPFAYAQKDASPAYPSTEETPVKLDVGMLTHDLKTTPDYARKIDAMGYDCLWSSETQHDAYLPLAVAATSTSRIKLGTNIATVFSLSPIITAHIAWDLAKASDGRFTLGLGTQVKAHNERRFSVKFESPGSKMAEAIRAIRTIWDCWQTGTRLNFKGQFYTFDVMTPFFNPGPIDHPKIPIFIAGVNPYMCGVAGELCDGLIVSLPRGGPVKTALERVRKAAAQAGRTLERFYTAALVTLVVLERGEKVNSDRVVRDFGPSIFATVHKRLRFPCIRASRSVFPTRSSAN